MKGRLLATPLASSHGFYEVRSIAPFSLSFSLLTLSLANAMSQTREDPSDVDMTHDYSVQPTTLSELVADGNTVRRPSLGSEEGSVASGLSRKSSKRGYEVYGADDVQAVDTTSIAPRKKKQLRRPGAGIGPSQKSPALPTIALEGRTLKLPESSSEDEDADRDGDGDDDKCSIHGSDGKDVIEHANDEWKRQQKLEGGEGEESLWPSTEQDTSDGLTFAQTTAAMSETTLDDAAGGTEHDGVPGEIARDDHEGTSRGEDSEPATADKSSEVEALDSKLAEFGFAQEREEEHMENMSFR